MRIRIAAGVGAGLTMALAVMTAFSTGAVASTSGAQPSRHGTPITMKYHPRAGTACYQQMDSDTGSAGVSDKFSDQKTLNSRAADDFTLTSDCAVTEVDILAGLYGWPGPVNHFLVRFYSDDGTGMPVKKVKGSVSKHDTFTYTDSGSGVNGEYFIALPKTVKLPAGTYWVSVEAQITLGIGGEMYWDTISNQTGSPAQWENPRGGFGLGCATWCANTTTGAVGPDLAFAIVQGS